MSSSNEVHFSEDLMNYFIHLDEGHKHWKWLNDLAGTLRENPKAGEHIRRRLIPEKYRREIKTLFRYQHPEGYRSLYTIAKIDENRFRILVLNFLTHKEYEKLFQYRGSADAN